MLRESSRKGEGAKKQVWLAEPYSGFAVAWYSRFWVLALRLRLGARSFDAAGKIRQRRKGAKKQVWLAEPYWDSQWPGIADFHVLALRLCASRKIL